MREDFANRAEKNVVNFWGKVLLNYQILIKDIYEGIDHSDFERVVLDLPEPWKTVPHLPACMVPGGILVAYTPSITQATRLRESLNSTDFVMQETFEVSRRTWHIEGQAVRPEHRMVGHTGFITQARFVGSS